MNFTPRPYQAEAITRGLEYFNNAPDYNAFEILPTGAGKSVVIANIASGLSEPTLVLQPSKEILEQNVKKFASYGYRAGIYSASAGAKYIEDITFATIGSVISKKHLFKHIKHIIVDECHLVNSEAGMYQEFIKSNPEVKVLGLTATPYRLVSAFDGAKLEFINRTKPRIFSELIYFIQNDVLFNAGHLAKLEYFAFDIIDRSQLEMNSGGTDFTTASLKNYYRQINMPGITTSYGLKMLTKRKNLLIFCSIISEAKEVMSGIPGSVVLTGDTEPSVRSKILSQFKAGQIRCVINVGVLTTGFDYPELECVLIARSTMSLALYYQIVGRAMRPHADKDSAWIVDLGGNVRFFGKIETMRIEKNDTGLYSIWNNGRQLTNVTFTKN
jgi:DNA repair protein RadD